MYVRAVAAAALLAVLPAAASAEAEERPEWSIGAGLGGIGAVSLSGGSGLGIGTLGTLFGPAVPVATFFVERRLGERSWLVFGATGSVRRGDGDAPQASATFLTSALTQDDSESVSLSAGLRRVVTGPGAIVEVSLQGTLEGGYLHAQQVVSYSDGTRLAIRDTGGYGSVTGGIAVERALTGGLGLRISTPLVGATWAKLEQRDDAGARDSTSASVFVTLAPRIELRLAF